MPRTQLIFFKDDDGIVPVRDWLLELQQRQRRAFAKCVTRIRRLAELGHELRRPEADLLRDGIYELRVRDGRVNYRLLYFFQEKQRGRSSFWEKQRGRSSFCARLSYDSGSRC